MKKSLLAAAVACAALNFMPATASAQPALGKVDAVYVAMSQFILLEYTPGMHTHDRPLVADVRLRDANGQPARRVMLRLEKETVDAGDIVAVNEGESGNGLRTAPLRSRDRLAHVEAKHDSLQARNFFNTTPKFLALRKDD